MATQTGRTRTITGYISDLLEYPRWVIEHDVDFTDCRQGGHYNAFIGACGQCRCGRACQWLDRHQATSQDPADFEQLSDALEGAMTYLRKSYSHDASCDCETCAWLREARHLRRSHLKST